jgi:ABC-type dipeptide/oligopeptide/nickel transport system ATPase component
MTDDAILSVEDMRVWYSGPGGPVPAGDGVSFALPPGEVLGLDRDTG